LLTQLFQRPAPGRWLTAHCASGSPFITVFRFYEPDGDNAIPPVTETSSAVSREPSSHDQQTTSKD
jgi:hypothetical protein